MHMKSNVDQVLTMKQHEKWILILQELVSEIPHPRNNSINCSPSTELTPKSPTNKHKATCREHLPEYISDLVIEFWTQIHLNIHPWQLTYPLKIDGWVRWNVLLKWSLFQRILVYPTKSFPPPPTSRARRGWKYCKPLPTLVRSESPRWDHPQKSNEFIPNMAIFKAGIPPFPRPIIFGIQPLVFRGVYTKPKINSALLVTMCWGGQKKSDLVVHDPKLYTHQIMMLFKNRLKSRCL